MRSSADVLPNPTLATFEVVQLLERVVNILSFLVRRISGLRRFVLILLRIQLEVEQAGEIAPGAAAPTTAATTSSARSKCHLNLTECGFST